MGLYLHLNEISLEIKQGEIVSLLGPNGAGKTTLLLTLSGILKTTEGRNHFRRGGYHQPRILIRSSPEESDMFLRDAISSLPFLSSIIS